MSDKPWANRWTFFIGVTLMLALPLALAYFYFGNVLSQNEIARQKRQLSGQLDSIQEQLYDTRRDAVADTYDDALQLGWVKEKAILRNTLRGYAYPDGRNFAEGIGIINQKGKLQPFRLAAVIDHTGRPLSKKRLDKLKKQTPWLEDPWLPNYLFVAQAFEKQPEIKSWQSPFIQAPGRMIFVVASAKRKADGTFHSAVILQYSLKALWSNLQAPASSEMDLWLMDRVGVLGLASTQLAQASAKAFLASGMLKKVLESGAKEAGQGQLGAAGDSNQMLAGESMHLAYRTLANDMVLGVVTPESEMGIQGAAVLRYLGFFSLWALLILAVAGAIYTVASLREQARMVEKKTLQRYAGTVSHRVRNDLSTVMGNLELISMGRRKELGQIQETIDKVVQPALDDIQATVQDLEKLSRGLVDLAKDGQLGEETMYDVKRSTGKGGKTE
jgi:uncharacterized protein YpmS